MSRCLIAVLSDLYVFVLFKFLRPAAADQLCVPHAVAREIRDLDADLPPKLQRQVRVTTFTDIPIASVEALSLTLPLSYSGFLYAYVVFLTADICLLLLSSQQSPEQFHAFHAKKEFMAQRLLHAGALESIHNSVQSHGSWKPHGDLPLLTHFIYKNELTGECVTPELDFPFEDDDHDTNMHLLGQYAKLHHVMYPTKASAPSSGSDSTTKSKPNNQPLGKRLPGLHDKIASRLAFVRSESGLFLGSCTDEYRLYACFDSLASVTEAKDQCQLLVERLRRDEGLMAPPFFVSGFGGGASSGLSMWP